ncbi:hypothetical protein [Chondromyces apiculatus]|uniref:Lipoprotein n=1 Tax=Chondromyces apiculatus DSM 436 TaxID=1192034 RepID=A0A017SV91_9BACT|nr:hypothetical protein [Chondromyces apiculatus]EYF00672.1 Hypothetical protein CAP_0363 [Chondromyces apiculatus DSM 436]
MNKLKALFLLTMLSFSVPACGGTAAEYCDLLCDCEGCNDDEYDECVVNTQASIDKAYEYDCIDEWDDVEACMLEKSDCRGDNFETDIDCLDDLAEAEVCVHDRSDGRFSLFSY